MNILFLTLLGFESIDERNIYTDLMRTFVRKGHSVYIISPVEKRQRVATHIIKEDNVTILRLQVGNTQKTNIFEKGISTVMIEPIFKQGIKKYFANVRFDLVLYSTPPITFSSAVKSVKMRDGAKTYLLLKDIFPQNAVDMGMLSTKGLKGILYQYFRNKERELYRISDYIGCMSDANVKYVIDHNPEVNPAIVGVCPNCIEIVDKSVNNDMRIEMRNRYKIPLNKKVFIYGGNLGKPQGIPFLLECLKKCREIENVFFLIIGDGTEYRILEDYVNASNQNNLMLMSRLPKDDYDAVVAACDVGMLFLDHRFTIPNFPSRLLSYLQAKLPVLAVTDPNTDIGQVIMNGEFGWWCESNDAEAFKNHVLTIQNEDYSEKGKNGWKYLNEHYSVENAYEKIIEIE